MTTVKCGATSRLSPASISRALITIASCDFFVDEKHGQVAPSIRLAQRQIYVLSLHVPALNTPHSFVILQCLFGFMHLDTMPIPELLNEVAVPDDAVDSHARCLKELFTLYPSSRLFAKGGTPTPAGHLIYQQASLEYHPNSQSAPVLPIVTYTTSRM